MRAIVIVHPSETPSRPDLSRPTVRDLPTPPSSSFHPLSPAPLPFFPSFLFLRHFFLHITVSSLHYLEGKSCFLCWTLQCVECEGVGDQKRVMADCIYLLMKYVYLKTEKDEYGSEKR
ncbi:hypothetical protein E2C01_043642 [Portunus trituberculatus]|uniref:Uncharacterized protein n=1 Tax=Portunus trituberculatus TaxID=210409 RepID=A0A5B7FWM7_PORTR|nr:hypothetical protein [Portunus trituberculatus]